VLDKSDKRMRERKGFAAFILAGGESARMGRDKALLEFGGLPLILRIAELLRSVAAQPTVIAPPEKFRAFGLPAIADDNPGFGPLGGIATALRATNEEWNLIVGCDLPFLTREWLAYLIQRATLSNADVVLPHSDSGAEPLCAVYRKRCWPSITAALRRGTRKITDSLAELPIENVPFEEVKPFDSDRLLFKNMNSPSDCEEVQAKFSRKEAV
jgi:molybdopterin-guanine dinucleotide biosynthesis protein A